MEGGHAAEKRKKGVYVPDFLVQEVQKGFVSSIVDVGPTCSIVYFFTLQTNVLLPIYISS